MSETPDRAAVEATLTREINEREETLRGENSEIKDLTEIAGNITALRQILTHEEAAGEQREEFEAERTALREAIHETAVAHAEEGVTETLINVWISGEEVQNQMLTLNERGARTYAELQDDPEAVAAIQQVARDLGHDLSDATPGEYDAITLQAWTEIQTDLLAAGYDLGAFGENNNGVDGKVGMVTMNILMSAAQGTAPTEVVEDAISAAANSPEHQAAVAQSRRGKFEAIGSEIDATTGLPEAKAGPINAADLDHYGETLSRSFPGITYNEADNTFSHELSAGNAESLELSEVIAANYEAVNLSEADNALQTFNVAQLEAFIENRDGISLENDNTMFVKDDRQISVNSILAAPHPQEKFTQWFNGEIEGITPPEETEIEASLAARLATQAKSIHGVRDAVQEGNTWNIQLFDNTSVPLSEVYNSASQALDTAALQTRIEAKAETLAGEMTPPLTFHREVPGSGGNSAYFTNSDGQIMAFLDEIANGTADESPQANFRYASNTLAAPAERSPILTALVAKARETR